MASTIGTNAQFATTNMKPDNGEQIDSLWGQNIADNTGYLFYKPEVIPGFSVHMKPNSSQDTPTAGTQWFCKRAGHSSLAGSFTFIGSSTGLTTAYTATMYVNGTLVKGTGFATLAKHTVAGSVVFDISSLTPGMFYPLSLLVTTSGFPASVDFDLSAWSVF